MGVDLLSPIAPARVKVLLLPLGKVKRSRFLSFVARLRPENVVRLGDISPDRRPDRTMFSPLAFPTGMIIFDLSTSLPSSSQLALAPFELFREPLLVIAIADSTETLSEPTDEGRSFPKNDERSGLAKVDVAQLLRELNELRENYPRALAHQVLLFDYTGPSLHSRVPEGIIAVPPQEQSRTTTIKTVMCDLASSLLAELTTFAKSLQGLPSIDTPTTSTTPHATSTYSTSQAEQARGLPPQATTSSHGLRSESPSDTARKVQQRMSMPARSTSISNAQSRAGPTARPTSSPEGGKAVLSSDTIDNQGISEPMETAVSKSSAGSTMRASSQDRVSVHGFGSGSLSERARNKGKGRVGVVVGTLYLNAGRWSDAVRELVESACIAKANLDHLWHAKALENILVCLLMLAWAGIDFQIPQICYPNAEKSSTSSFVKSPNHTPTNSTSDITSTKSASVANRLASLQNLTNILPDLLNTIINLYSRSTGETLPHLAYSECVIRFSKLLSAMHLCDGKLDDSALRHIVLKGSFPRPANLMTARINIHPTRTEITSILFRAVPPPAAMSLTTIDRTVILAGIISVLSSLGFYRKKAVMLKEMISNLIPALVQARKVGAAEMGVHPAAGLAALNTIGGTAGGAAALSLSEGDIEIGVKELLGMIGAVYGVVGLATPQSSTSVPIRAESDGELGTSNRAHEHEEDDQAIVAKILQNSTLRSFGSRNLKMDILRSCINLCEALPDFHGVLRFTSELLQTAGSGIAPSPDSSDGSTLLAREEQIRLATNITRTIGAAKKLGIDGAEAEFWDDFLLRGVEVQAPASWRTPIPRAKSELDDVGAVEEKKEKSPFIYNPFLKKPSATTVEPILVCGEQADFRVTLQNPYDFDVEVDSVKLETKGVEIQSTQQGVIIGPYRTQTLFVSGTPRSSGMLHIMGCVIKVRGCRERRFPIFTDAWSPDRGPNFKQIGLAAAKRKLTRPFLPDEASTKDKGQHSHIDPKPSSFRLSVVPELPIVVMKTTTLSQAAIMILEGETKTFTITLQNLSMTTSADLVFLSFQDSTTAPLQAAMSNKDIPPAELYELELLFSRRQAFHWRRKEAEPTLAILPGGSVDFEIDILGKPGLTSGIIQVDYTHLGVSRSAAPDKIYTRQMTIPITVTVNASVELVRVDLLPFTSNFAWSNKQRQFLANGTADSQSSHHRRQRTTSRPTAKGESRFQSLFERLGVGLHDIEHCLLLLDLRNAWPQPLSISLQVLENRTKNETFEDTWKRAYTVHEILQPGHVSRLVLLLPKIHLKNPHAPIPTLNPANQRQFVVSASKVAPEVERAAREAFWFREEVLNHVRGNWEEEGTGKTGAVELRGIRLSPRMVDALKVEDVGIEMAIAGPADETESTVRQTGQFKFEVSSDEFLTLKTRITNRTQQPIHPLLRLQPSLSNQPHNIALDLSKRFAWNGLLQRPLPLLEAGQTTEVDLGICILCKGEFEVGASVEEVRLWKPPSEEEAANSGRARADTNALLAGRGLGERERRIWHSREACIIIAKDGDGDG